ncbi:hypothetical protein B0H14DRAFT_2627136 [Mycena olivaceomarginata]|nr:hypothetical protein B0H14DRAFT_2627136 [Mycena olivaceomarginata]
MSTTDYAHELASMALVQRLSCARAVVPPQPVLTPMVLGGGSDSMSLFVSAQPDPDQDDMVWYKPEGCWQPRMGNVKTLLGGSTNRGKGIETLLRRGKGEGNGAAFVTGPTGRWADLGWGSSLPAAMAMRSDRDRKADEQSNGGHQK